MSTAVQCSGRTNASHILNSVALSVEPCHMQWQPYFIIYLRLLSTKRLRVIEIHSSFIGSFCFFESFVCFLECKVYEISFRIACMRGDM